MSKKLAIFGSSGFAFEVADIAYSLGFNDIVLLSNDIDCLGVDGRLDIISESEVSKLVESDYVFAIGIGEPNIRKKIANKYNNLDFLNLIHPKAVFGHGQLDQVLKQKGNIITDGVVMINNIKIGDFGVYNLNATVGHDCIIGDFVSIMPSVNISGNVILQDEVFIGVGAVVLQGNPENKIKIGQRAIVGASSLVTKSVEDNTIVFGIPARKLRK